MKCKTAKAKLYEIDIQTKNVIRNVILMKKAIDLNKWTRIKVNINYPPITQFLLVCP